MIAWLRRLLFVALGMPSPSVVALVERTRPPPRSWLARREQALALKHLGSRPSLAELAAQEARQIGDYAEKLATIIDTIPPGAGR